MTDKPCREELRGGEARCNGGAYDGCACGPYNVADYKKMEELSWTRKVGTTKYRRAEASDIVGAKVMNADCDAVYLEKGSGAARRQFVISLQVAYGDAIQEYKGV